MSITDTSRDLTSDNVRALKKWLMGRGVNYRRTIVESEAVYAEDRIIVPTLRPRVDKIISIINWTDGNDITALLDPDLSGTPDTLTVFSGNKGIVFTSRKPIDHSWPMATGTINVKAQASSTYVMGAPTAVPNQPLTALWGKRNFLLGGGQPLDHTMILVRLATDENGDALTTDVNSAANVLTAIQYALESPVSLEVDKNAVAVALTGDGSEAWTNQFTTPLTVGTPPVDPGPTAASLQTLLDPYPNSDLIFTAREPGAAGNSITIEYVAGVELAVDVTGTDIVVTFDEDETTAEEVMDAVNTHPVASALVIAKPAHGPVPNVLDGTGIVIVMAQTPLAGGLDPSILLTEASAGKKLLIDWVSYTDDNLDDDE